MGHYLTPADEGELVALAPGPNGEKALRIDVRSRTPKSSFALPRRVQFRSVLVGPKTRRLYFVGNAASGLQTPLGTPAHAALLMVASPEGRVLTTTTLRDPRRSSGRGAPYDWHVYAATI